MLKAFIFDMDGVIIDSEPLHFEVDLYTLNSIGIASSKEELEQYVGMTNPEMWRLIKAEYQLAHSIEELIQLQLTKKLAYLDESDIEPISGIREPFRNCVIGTFRSAWPHRPPEYLSKRC